MSVAREADVLDYASPAAILGGGGEMGARMRAIDWSKTPLGPVASWPQSLKTCVRIILTSRQAMFIWWGDALINLYNDAYKSIVGGKHPEALGQPASVVWREIWEQIGPRAESSMRGNEGTYDESLLLVMERNGYQEETYYTFSYSPVPNDHGGTGGILCANTDDTQRIIGERQLSLLKELTASSAEARTWEDACARSAAALAVNTKDLPFALIYVVDGERRWLKLAGSTGVERGHAAAPGAVPLAGETLWPFAEVLRTHAVVQVTDLAQRFGPLPTGGWDRPPTEAVVLPIVPSGETGRGGVLIVGLNPYRLWDDAYRGFLGLVSGQISASVAHAQAYEDEKTRAEALATIDRAKTTFFSNVSHEFRTPLTLMLGPIEDALASSARSLSGENLDTTYRNSIRLLKLVNALLDFSRIEAGRAHASYQLTDIAAITADLASAFRSAIERAQLVFEVDCPPVLEEVYVDRDMWEKIVLNLLSNALKFTFEGTIGVSLRSHGDRIDLTVRDTGTGVPESEVPHLFERFHRVQGARSRTHEGSGIGLALVYELVRLHGGTINVVSVVGAGTSFTISLPHGKAHLPQDRVNAGSSLLSTATGAAPYVHEALRWLPGAEVEPGAESLAVTALSAPGVGVIKADPDTRILLADDNADMREYVGRVLRERWTVDAAADGAAALELARKRPPDLVLTDVMMPNVDGFGLLRALRSDEGTRNVPVVMLSARAGDESRIEGLEAGADDYLVKPFSARELVARVATHLQLARLRTAAERGRAKLYELFMQAPTPLAVFAGAEHRYEVANPPYCELIRRPHLIGMKVRDVFPEFGAHELIATLDRVYGSGESVRGLEMRIPSQRAEDDAYFNYVAQPIRDTLGTITGVMLVAFDVTDEVQARRRVERLGEELRKNEERHRSLIDVTAQTVWTSTPEGQMAGDQPAWSSLTGQTLEEYRGLGWASAVHAGDRENTLRLWGEAIATRGVFLCEHRIRCLNGAWREFSTRAVPVLETDGSIREWVGVHTDVTEKRRAEREREELIAALANSNQELDRFAYVASHDLKAPLRGIASLSEWIEDSLAGKMDDEGRSQMRLLRGRVHRLGSLIDGILSYSRAGRSRNTAELVDTGRLLAEVVELLSPPPEARVEAASEMPTFLTERVPIQQVLQNLIGNALKHARRDDPLVTVSCTESGMFYEFAVKDNGPGIHPRYHERIWELFQTLEARDKVEGTGIGLAVVKKIVENRGGRVWVESRPGEGATFFVRWPKRTDLQQID